MMKKLAVFLVVLLLSVLPLSLALAETETLKWNFDSGIGAWGVEGSWEYPAGFSADNVSYDADMKALLLSPLSFDKNKNWSEIKLNIPVQTNLTPYRLFRITLIAESEAYKAAGGSFKVQPIAILAGGGYNALTNSDPLKTTERDGLTRLEYEMGLSSDLDVVSITVGIAGINTAYTGKLWVDDIGFFTVEEGVYTGVNAQVKPVSNREAQKAEIAESGEIAIVDKNATAKTRSLFEYLKDVGKDYLLFGHQNAMHHGITVKMTDGTESDAKNAVGAHPAIIGIDGLSIVSGAEGSYAQSVQIAKNADKSGCILTISMHMPNFTTGKGYNDITEGAIADVLPGGKSHEKLKQYLDTIASFAFDCVSEDGEPIPMIMRPYHENNYGWFWWGTSGGNQSEYRELYRFTVEYLRDVKGVHSFLYAYSPNGPIGSEKTYLQLYPGDNYVDIIGMDYYCINMSKNSDIFFAQLLSSLRILSDMAEARGKISALCESGVSQGDLGYGGLAVKDNGDCETWFEDMAERIMGDEKARRISYFLVWANFGEKQFWVPFARPGDRNSHEMIDDFTAFYNDDRVIFADRTGDIFSHGAALVPAPEAPCAEVVFPLDKRYETKEGYTFLAKVEPYGCEITEITYTVKAHPDVVFTPALNPESGLYEAYVDLTDVKSNWYDTEFTVKFSNGTEQSFTGAISRNK